MATGAKNTPKVVPPAPSAMSTPDVSAADLSPRPAVRRANLDLWVSISAPMSASSPAIFSSRDPRILRSVPALLAVYAMCLLPPDVWCAGAARSEEHTSELQSRPHLVCRLLLE